MRKGIENLVFWATDGAKFAKLALTGTKIEEKMKVAILLTYTGARWK